MKQIDLTVKLCWIFATDEWNVLEDVNYRITDYKAVNSEVTQLQRLSYIRLVQIGLVKQDFKASIHTLYCLKVEQATVMQCAVDVSSTT